jgi:hypothetical protein
MSIVAESVLYQAVSALVAILVMFVWVRPQMFRFLLDKGSDFPSLGRQGQYTAMIVSTWVIATVTLENGLSEWLFIGYMFAWAGAQFGSTWLKLQGRGTTVTSSSSSTESSKPAA